MKRASLLLSTVFLLLFLFPISPAYANPDFQVKKGTFQKITTTGSQTVSGVGFQPKTVIFWWTRQTSYGELAAVHIGYGFASYYDGAYQNCGVAFASDDAAASSNAGRRRSATYCIIILSSGTPVMSAQASVTAFGSDGFTLNWQTNENRADIIHYIALGGTTLTNVKAGSFTLQASTGLQDVTTVGFQPNFVMFLWTYSEAVDTDTSHAEIGMGFAKSSIKRGAIVANSEDGRATMDTWQQQRTDSCILTLTASSGAQNAIVDFSQFLSNGFQINIITAPSVSTAIFYLALSGGNYDVGSFNSPATTGTQDITTVGFLPKLLILATQGRTSGTAIGSTSELAFGGAISSSERGCTWFEDPDALADSDNEQESLNTIVIQWRDRTAADTFTLRGSADFVQFLSNGFRLNWTSVDANGREVIYVAFGDVGAIYNFYGSINSQITIGSKKICTFYRFSFLNQTLSIVSKRNYEFNRFSLIGQSISIISERTWTFTEYKILNSQFTVNSQKTVAFTIFSTINPSFSIASITEFITGQILNLFGSISQTISIAFQRNWVFSKVGLINPQFTVDLEKQYTFSRFSSITESIFIESQRNWAFNRFSALNPQFTVGFQKSVAFDLFSALNPRFSVSSTIELITKILNFFGDINQAVSIDMQRTTIFNLYPSLNPTFTVSGWMSLWEHILNFFGNIQAFLNIEGWTDLPIPAIPITRMWAVWFTFGGVGFVFGVFALIYMRKKEKEEKEEFIIKEEEYYTEEEESSWQ